MNRTILFASLSEVLYLSLSFAIAQFYGQWSVTGELLRTFLRIASLLYLGYCYKHYFYDSRQALNIRKTFTIPFISAVQLLIVFALVYSNALNETVTWQIVFFFSGLIAGFREELFYRGMIQKTLQARFDYKIALAIGTLVFTLAHLQYLYAGQFRAVLMIASAGLIFGSIFIHTGCVVFTALVHGLYDAVLAINVMPFRLNYQAALPVMLTIVLLFLLIINKSALFTKQTDDAYRSDRDDYSLS